MPRPGAGVKTWTGRELSEDLARTLQTEDQMTWVNLPLGSVQMSNVQIADVVALNKSFANALVKIYEIKVDRGDFFGDIGRLKYQGYFKSAHQVYFAVPQGLVKKDELPADGVGLIVRTDSTWQVIKAARRTDFKLGEEFLLKLLMRGYEDHWQQYRSAARRKEEVKIYTTLHQAYYDYGVKVAKDIAQAQEIKVFAEQMLKDIGRIMGKDYGKAYFRAVVDLKSDVTELMNQHKFVRLALPVSALAERLFKGDLYSSPVRELEQLLEQAKREFGEQKDLFSNQS